MFCGGRQVFQVGQAPSGPAVIRPLHHLQVIVRETGLGIRGVNLGGRGAYVPQNLEWGDTSV